MSRGARCPHKGGSQAPGNHGPLTQRSRSLKPPPVQVPTQRTWGGAASTTVITAKCSSHPENTVSLTQGLRKPLSAGGVGERQMRALKRRPPERVVMDPLVHNSFQNQRLTAAIGSLSLNLPTLNILVTVWLKTIARSWGVSARPHQKQGLMEL